jgi:hypothetical protein
MKKGFDLRGSRLKKAVIVIMRAKKFD